MDGPERCGERERWLLGEFLRKGDRFFQEFVACHNPIDEAEIQRLLCVELPSAENQFRRCLTADVSWQPLRSTERRNDADIDLRLAEDGGVCGESEMYRFHELAASAERKPVDRRDDGFWIRLDAAGQPMAGPHEMCDRLGGGCFSIRLGFRHVGARAGR